MEMKILKTGFILTMFNSTLQMKLILFISIFTLRLLASKNLEKRKNEGKREKRRMENDKERKERDGRKEGERVIK